jgi:hypothetical protein
MQIKSTEMAATAKPWTSAWKKWTSTKSQFMKQILSINVKITFLLSPDLLCKLCTGIKLVQKAFLSCK